jgi:glycosyltransferase involved in cell wall biosynthesis
MASPARVSVIIPAYNAGACIAEAIESVLDQSYPHYEIIIVDDGSTDTTKDVLEAFADKVTFIKQKHRGAAASRNAGIERAGGNYLTFLDADDLLLPTKLSVQASFLDNNPEIDVVYSDGYIFYDSEDGLEVEQPFSETWFLDKTLSTPPRNIEVLLIRNAFPINAAMVRKDRVAAVGGFDETLAALEDWELWFRLGQKYNFAFLDEKVAKYRLTGIRVTKDIRRQKVAFEQVKKRFEASQVFAGLPDSIKCTFYLYFALRSLRFRDALPTAERLREAFRYGARDFPGSAAYFCNLIYLRAGLGLTRLVRKTH